jgi:DNA-binding LytR/AlgR family response regulator
MSDLFRANLPDTELQDPPDASGNTPLRPGVHQAAAEKSPKTAEFRSRMESSAPKPMKIAFKTKGKILLIDPADILAVEAEGNYVLLQRQSNSYLLRESISTMAEKLREYGFVRIHRSVLVNSSWVEEIHPGTTGEYVLRIAGGREYVVSRTYKNNLRSLAQSWIGTDSFIDD